LISTILAGASGENPALEAQIMNIFEPTETAPKILVADDDPAIVRLLADRCCLMGFEVETVSNGLQALGRLRRGGIDTLIIDVQMPELDGLSVSAYLLEYSKRPLHVIVATGRRDAETVGTCDSMGAFYVRKGGNFWEDLESALVEAYPAKAGRIRQSGLRSTGTAVPMRSRVLLVDDDLDVEGFLRGRLDKCGIDTLFAADAEQGYRIACRDEPAAIVSDYSMPNGNARYLLSRLRTTPATKDIPFIVLSGREISAANERSLKRDVGGRPGAAQIVRKSADTAELIGALRKVCGLETSMI
jgi:CheY-like chemotaxis protein